MSRPRVGVLALQGDFREHLMGEPQVPPVVVIDRDAVAILEQHEFSPAYQQYEVREFGAGFEA